MTSVSLPVVVCGETSLSLSFVLQNEPKPFQPIRTERSITRLSVFHRRWWRKSTEALRFLNTWRVCGSTWGTRPTATSSSKPAPATRRSRSLTPTWPSGSSNKRPCQKKIIYPLPLSSSSFFNPAPKLGLLYFHTGKNNYRLFFSFFPLPVSLEYNNPVHDV